MKKIVIAILTTLFTFSMSINTFAAGWQKNSTGWWYDNGNGTWLTNTWEWIDGNNDGVAECYYFNNEGYMLENVITPDGYTVNADGAWTVNGVIQTRKEYIPDITFSAHMGEINGTMYYTNEMGYEINISDCNLFPVKPKQGNIISTFCYYNNYVYYIECEQGTFGISSWLYRCKTDWTNKELLDEIIFDWESSDNDGEKYFLIDHGILYYGNPTTSNTETTAINLSNLTKFKAERPKYSIYDNGQVHNISYDSYYNTDKYDIAIYGDNVFFKDTNDNIYKQENGNKKLLATNAQLHGGFANGYLYYIEYDWSSYISKLYRVSVNGGTKQFIDSKMIAGI